MSSLLVLILASGVWAAPAADKVEAGQKVYAVRCAGCHSKDGKGNARLASKPTVDIAKLDLTSAQTQKKSQADLVKILSNGGTLYMPNFKNSLTAEEIENVAAYVLSLGGTH